MATVARPTEVESTRDDTVVDPDAEEPLETRRRTGYRGCLPIRIHSCAVASQAGRSGLCVAVLRVCSLKPTRVLTPAVGSAFLQGTFTLSQR
jgi:hypothetical protein